MYIPLTELKVVPRWYPPVPKASEVPSWFASRELPTVLDIGCGRGAFMMQYALANPSERILGIEVRDTWVRWVNGVIDGERIPNARAVWHTVVNGLEFLEPHSIREAFYLFPDPWPKRRHEKRRAFTASFLDDLVRVLRPGGMLHLATDVPEVEEYELQVLEEHGAFSVLSPLSSDQWGFPFHTDQEKFCLAKGIPYNRFRAILK